MRFCTMCDKEINNNWVSICDECKEEIKNTPHLAKLAMVKSCFHHNTFNVAVIENGKVETMRKDRKEILQFITEDDIMNVEVKKEYREEMVTVVKDKTIWVIATGTVDFGRE